MTLKVQIAWWFKPYLAMLVFFCCLMNTQPNSQKLSRVIKRAVIVKAAKQEGKAR